MTTYFENKEHYIAFRKAWAAAVNSDRSKKTLTEEKNWRGGIVRIRRSGWITSAHHMLFNILRNRPIETGFTPVTNSTKLSNGSNFNYAVVCAAATLRGMVKEARIAIDKGDMFGSSNIISFLEPFDGTVTIQMIATLTIPPVETLSPTWREGKQVGKKIIDGEAKPKSFAELQALYNEVA